MWRSFSFSVTQRAQPLPSWPRLYVSYFTRTDNPTLLFDVAEIVKQKSCKGSQGSSFKKFLSKVAEYDINAWLQVQPPLHFCQKNVMKALHHKCEQCGCRCSHSFTAEEITVERAKSKIE